ncbi:30S ribosomal protein S6 [Mycoplasma sp. Mirounga ES2805-ORL]|uniref:30S ribosomal protein S6 n=1 Tax=Mycoplasma sp. Mirounga ES2805-ORL TaxID=754514 RepID=UPI00197BC2A0|nr:30S ribosomal protein S6 [Mycoplasma sp. Mirounga ES2805-ORL]QSF13636.1 30S ribosomal protein S6 [Mycoplasma sp. Mirounga ES2805-ORL]
MQKYEIMMILDPKVEPEIGFNLVESVFGKKNILTSEKLERTDLAYPINKSLKAQYLLFTLNSETNLIAEFSRRCNITKEIWRNLVINLSFENKPKKENKRKRNSRNSEYANKNENSKFSHSKSQKDNITDENKDEKPRVRKPRTKKVEETK